MRPAFTVMLLLVLSTFTTSCGSGGGSNSGVGNTTSNTVPVANAGPGKNAITGTLVTLNGSGSSDADGDALTYIWSFSSKPPSSVAILSSVTVSSPMFTADKDGAYVLNLVVNDGKVDSAASSVTITAVTPVSGKIPDTNQTTSYTSTFGEDHDYTINPPSYTDNGNGTIRDNVTGLIWQKQDDATERTWANASTYCDSLVLGSQTDWRLPSRIELISIVDYGVYGPAINTTFFPDTQSSDYWSSITYASFTSYAWNVAFYGGNTNTYLNKTNSYYVRCVRGGETTQSLTDNGNGTVTDSGTLLTWQQGENNVTSVEAALSYCEGLYLAGYADWRLPNVKELSSIVDDTRYNPAINTTFFPDTSSSTYWSSTTYTGSASYAWGVYAWGVGFSYGGTGYFNKEAYFGLPPESKGVRCVRGGQ